MFFSSILYVSGMLKFIFNLKNLMISLLSMEVMGVSVFILMLSLGNMFFFIFFFICFMVGGSCVGLSLLASFNLNISKNLMLSMNNILC